MLRPLLLMLFALVSTGAQGSEPPAGHVDAALVSESTSVEPGKPVWVALHLRHRGGWHTYWRNPGESGLVTTIKWELPEGYQASAFDWPAPERIEVPPVVSFGYGGEILLLSRVDVPSSASGTAKLGGTVKWLECREICIPGRGQVSLELPVKSGPPAPDTKWAPRFAKARLLVPARVPDWKVEPRLSSTHATLTVRGSTPPKLAGAEFYPFEKDVLSVEKPKVTVIEGGFTLEMPRQTNGIQSPESLSGVLTFRDPAGGRQAVELHAPLRAPAPTLAEIGRMVLFALMGGLILNLMPCVFPLISIKVLGLVEQSRQDHSKIRTHWLVFSLGTLLSFWALAAILIAFKATGEKLGWGFQLQSPVFLSFLIALFYLLSLNLLGFFEIGIGLTSFGSRFLARGGYAGSFFSGVLTTIVATPCSAPFMGAAIGFALSQNAGIALLVFTSLGLGLLSPYLVLAAFPRLVRFLPRPGKWMENFKQLLAFPLLATVIWLSWTLGLAAGPNAVAVAWLALLSFSFGIWGLVRLKAAARPVGLVGFLAGAALIAVIGSSSFPIVQAGGQRATAAADDGIPWQPYSRASLAELRKAGKPVFLDFTAAWCITCQVNERVVFSSSEIRDRFKRSGIVPMKADWTNRDPEIADALAEFGRSGIPLYVVYGKGEPKILPELITPGIVLSELDKAGVP
ncbi:MAG TPA: thioredoxin family protein [Bdellovibrionota bacterium]|nr:thioredoxin family protein [Bdellovibrionota bacterium]